MFPSEGVTRERGDALPKGAKSFLTSLCGARASIPELIILGFMFKKKLVFAFTMNVFFVAIAAGFLVEWLVY